MPFAATDTPSSGTMRSPTIAGHARSLRVAPPTRTRGEIEAAVCDGIRRFALEYLGRGPKDVHTHLIENLLLVRMTGVLTSAEQHLAALPARTGRDLIKQVRTQLVEMARPALEAMITAATGGDVVSLHHDVSTVTGEEVVIFTLSESPRVREPKRK